ncbi:archaeal proteasome endopeptidase complex subunit beta [Thermococcus sp.]
MADKLKGTTTVGIACSDGIVLAADRRASISNMVMSKNVTKIFKIDEHSALAGAGNVGDILGLVRVLRSESSLYKARVGKKMSVKALATLTSNILHRNRLMPYLGWFLIGGFDGEGRLYSIDMAGGLTDDKFAAAGSGMEFAYAVLESEYKKDIKVKEAIKLAVKAINIAMRRDIFTGDGIMVVKITKDGYKELGKDEIEAILKEL